MLILLLAGRSSAAGVFVAGIAVAAYALVDEKVVGTGLLKQLMGAGGAISVASKLPQIYTVFAQGGTGQLSAFAVCFFFFFPLFENFAPMQHRANWGMVYRCLIILLAL